MRALASHQCGLGSNPGFDAIFGLSLLMVLSLALRGFSWGTPVFPSTQKPTFPNSSLTTSKVDEEPLSGCAISVIIIIIFITAPFINMQTLKLKSCFAIAFFNAVNHNHDHKKRTLKHRNTQNGLKSTNHKSQTITF